MEAGHNSLALTLATAAAFLLFAGGFWAIASLGHWALAPVQRPAIAVRLPLQFSFREMFLLMLQMQAAVAASLWWSAAGGLPMWLVVLAVAISTLAIWCHGVLRLSRAGVRCPLRRAALLLVVSPGMGAAILAALWVNGRAVVELLTGQTSPWAPWLAANLAILAAFVTCRMLTIWIMSDMRPVVAAADDDGIHYVSN